MLRLTRVLRLGAGAHGHGSTGSKEFGGASYASGCARASTGRSPFFSLPGFHAPHVDPIYNRLSTLMGAVTVFWILYRAKEDGAVVIGA
jgi:hypothetical protein